jgi:hypothetical protein
MIKNKYMIYGAVVIVAILIGAYLFPGLLAEDNTKEWGQTDDNIAGLWVTDVMVVFEDGTRKSLSDMQDETLSVKIQNYYTEQNIKSLIFYLRASATGTYDYCYLDFNEANFRMLANNAQVISESSMVYIKEEGFTVSGATMPVDGVKYDVADKEWVVNVDTALHDALVNNPSATGYYWLGFGVSGTVKYRGDPSEPWLIAETDPSMGFLRINVIEDEITVSFTGGIEVIYE